MGLNLSRPTPSQPQPSQGQAPAAPKEEESYQQYDISADRQMMTQTLVNSPEVDALASHGTPARRQEILKENLPGLDPKEWEAFWKAPELEKLIADVQKKMKKAAAELNFEAAAELRDQMVDLKKLLADMD